MDSNVRHSLIVALVIDNVKTHLLVTPSQIRTVAHISPFISLILPGLTLIKNNDMMGLMIILNRLDYYLIVFVHLVD